MSFIGVLKVLRKGSEVQVEWKIEDLDSLAKKLGVEYTHSESFSFEGEQWYFFLHPNGKTRNNSSGHVDLSLWRPSSGNDSLIPVLFSFAFKAPNGEKVSERQRREIFKDGDEHYLERFMSREEYGRRKSEFLDSESLTVVCTLKKFDAVKEFSHLNKEYKAAQSMLEKTTKEIEELKKELAACKTEKETLLKDEMCLCEYLKEMLLNGISHDLILRVGDQEFRAHQDVLRTRSQVFMSMLSHDMKERNSGVIDIPDCDPQAMEQFLCYIYTGKVNSLDQSNMLKLYYLADKYEMEALKEKCHAFIEKSLSITNICDVIQLALNHSDCGLLQHATEYFTDNALDVMRTVEWQLFMRDNLTVANELNIKAFEKLKKANTCTCAKLLCQNTIR